MKQLELEAASISVSSWLHTTAQQVCECLFVADSPDFEGRAGGTEPGLQSVGSKRSWVEPPHGVC